MDLVQHFSGMPLDEELDYRIGNSHSNLTTARVHLHSGISVVVKPGTDLCNSCETPAGSRRP